MDKTSLYQRYQHRLGRAGRYLLLALLLQTPIEAQLVVKLTPRTVEEFEHYAAGVETRMEARWSAQKAFLFVEENPQDLRRALDREIFVKQMNDGHPVSITDGLIHDWLGAVYIPNARIEQVVQVLEDFDNHKKIYPSVSQSRTVARKGDAVTGYWRLQQKGLVPVILDVEEDVRFSAIDAGKWKGVAYARNITEVDTSLFTRGRKFPLGQGHGYLWRLYGYWSLETYKGGVLAECRTLSLSRDIPQGLAWAVGPYVQKQPEESLLSTLKATREALGR